MRIPPNIWLSFGHLLYKSASYNLSFTNIIRIILPSSIWLARLIIFCRIVRPFSFAVNDRNSLILGEMKFACFQLIQLHITRIFMRRGINVGKLPWKGDEKAVWIETESKISFEGSHFEWCIVHPKLCFLMGVWLIRFSKCSHMSLSQSTLGIFGGNLR